LEIKSEINDGLNHDHCHSQFLKWSVIFVSENWIAMKTKITSVLLFTLLLSSFSWSQNQENYSIVSKYTFSGNVADQADSLQLLKSKVKPIFSAGRENEEKGALKLDGTASFQIPLSIIPDSMAELTIALWVKPTAGSNGVLLGTSTENSGEKGRGLMVQEGAISTFYNSNDSNNTLSLPLRADEWNFVAVSYHHKKGITTLFVNEETVSGKGELSNAEGNTILGSTRDNKQRIAIEIDEITFFDKALITKEMATVGGYMSTMEKAISTLKQDWYWYVIILAFLFAMIYMPYVWYRDWTIFKPVTVEQLSDLRKQDSSATLDTENSNELAYNYLESAFESWTVVEGKGDDEVRTPLSRKDVLKSLEWINKAIALNPTSEQVVERINELGNIVNNQMKRVFRANNFLLITAIIVYVAMMYFMGKEDFWQAFVKNIWLFISITVYIASCFTPKFLVEKQARNAGNRRSGGGVPAAIIGALVGMFMSEPLTRRVRYKWSDGRVTDETETDLSPVLFLMIAAVFAFIFSVMIGIFGIINFFRNYLFYI